MVGSVGEGWGSNQLAGYPFHVTVDFINISRGCGGEVGWRATGAFGCQGLAVWGLAVEPMSLENSQRIARTHAHASLHHMHSITSNESHLARLSSRLLLVLGFSWLLLAAPGCSQLLMAATGCSCLLLAAPGWLLLGWSQFNKRS